MTATSHQFEIEEEWDDEASFAIVEVTKLMSSELADYRLDNARSQERADNNNDWDVQDGFAQVVDTTSIEVNHEGEKSFALTTSKVDEIEPHTGEDVHHVSDEIEPHTGEDVHHVPDDVKVFEKVKTKSDLIMQGQQMDNNSFARLARGSEMTSLIK
ncbi:hypothetical protein AMTRI_Chr12g241350 [Amborella trichopoda]